MVVHLVYITVSFLADLVKSTLLDKSTKAIWVSLIIHRELMWDWKFKAHILEHFMWVLTSNVVIKSQILYSLLTLWWWTNHLIWLLLASPIQHHLYWSLLNHMPFAEQPLLRGPLTLLFRVVTPPTLARAFLMCPKSRTIETHMSYLSIPSIKWSSFLCFERSWPATNNIRHYLNDRDLHTSHAGPSCWWNFWD